MVVKLIKMFFNLRNVLNKDENDYKQQPAPGVETIWDAFKHSRERLPNENFLGSRDPTQEGSPYVWKTWAQVDTLVNQLAAGIAHMGLMPEVEEEGDVFKFMGIYAKNREEWTITDLAALRQSGTVIAFYDNLGPSAVEFVIR